MKRTYKRIKVNKGLLKEKGTDLEKYLANETSDQLPAGEVVGLYFNSYIDENAIVTGTPQGDPQAYNALPFSVSNTDIHITDAQSQLLTEPTDIRDYQHKSGGYIQGFKKIQDTSKPTQITIRWETIGTTPICGEFVFVIEQSNCEC